MALTEKDIEQLEQLWVGSLAGSERQILEQRLQTDAAFKKEALQLQLVYEALQVVEKRDLRDKLQNLEKTLPPVPPPPPNVWLRYLLVAMALALVAFVVWYFGFRKDEEVALSPLVATYFEPYPAIGLTMGENDENDFKKKALKTYAIKDYKEAVIMLQKAFEVEPDSMLLFYKSIAYMGNGESANAQLILKDFQNSNIIPTELIDWYLALTYIDMNQKDKAISLLEKVTIIESDYQKKAIDLLRELRK